MVDASRRRFLKYAAAAAVGAGVAGALAYEGLSNSHSAGHGGTGSAPGGGSYKPPANATPDYAEFLTWLASVSKPYAGQSLDLSLEYEFTPLSLQALDLDFYGATGINDQYDLKSYFLHLSDISLMVRTQAPTYDAYTVDPQDVSAYVDAIISPTELAATYPDLTYEPFASSDYYDTAWSYLATYPPGPYQNSTSTSSSDVGFIPLDMATMIQFYRTDVYQALGLTPATTWDDYVSNAKAAMGSTAYFGTVNESTPDVSVVTEFANFLASYGGEYWDIQNGELVSAMSSDAALTALETYASLQPYADGASYTYSWPDVANDLLRGVGAAAIEFNSYAIWMSQTARSTVVGKVGFAPNPAGPNGTFGAYGGGGIGISRFSQHPEAAWLWLQWATAKGTAETALLGEYQTFPARKSVWDSPAISGVVNLSPTTALGVTKQLWDSDQIVCLPSFPKWYDVLDPLSEYLSQAWRGQISPSDAITTMIQKIDSWGTLTF